MRIRFDRNHTSRVPCHANRVQAVMTADIEHQVVRRKHVVADESQLSVDRTLFRGIPKLSGFIPDAERKRFSLDGFGDVVWAEPRSPSPQEHSSGQPCDRRGSYLFYERPEGDCCGHDTVIRAYSTLSGGAKASPSA